MKQIIFLRGKAGSGKDFYGDLLLKHYNDAEKLSLAKPLKQIIAATFDISLETLDKLKRTEHSTNPNRAMRSILQRFGTEGMKPIFGKDVWSELLFDTIQKSSNNIFIVSDLRFDSELAYFKNKEFIITVVEIHRKDLNKTDSMYEHSSEQGFKDSTPDIEINNIIGESAINLQKIISAQHYIVLKESNMSKYDDKRPETSPDIPKWDIKSVYSEGQKVEFDGTVYKSVMSNEAISPYYPQNKYCWQVV